MERARICLAIHKLFVEKYGAKRKNVGFFIYAHFPGKRTVKKLNDEELVQLFQYLLSWRETNFCCDKHNKMRGFYRRERSKMNNSWALKIKEDIKMGRAVCQNCGGDKDLTLDHIVPLAKGGLTEPLNIAVLCATCNETKGSETWNLMPYTRLTNPIGV